MIKNYNDCQEDFNGDSVIIVALVMDIHFLVYSI